MATTAPMFLELDQEQRQQELDEQQQELLEQQDDSKGQPHEDEHDWKGMRILLAAEKGQVLNLVRYLSEDRDMIDFQDSDGYSALHRASYAGSLDCAKYLVRHGANIEAQTVENWTPLHSAVRWNNIAIAEYLISQGANVNAKSNGNNTPLHIVASNGRYSVTGDIIRMLLYHPDCDYTIRNSSGDTAFDIAKRSGPFYKLWIGVETFFPSSDAQQLQQEQDVG